MLETNTPEKVLDAWLNQFVFRLEGEGDNEPGLRLPQIGALHAIAAHFSVGTKFEPATVVLPTGTGKTETMLAAQVYLRPKRTMVLVSGIPLREQIENKFCTLGYLPTAGAVPLELPGPRVAEISGSIKDVAEAQALLQHANVLIGLPNSLDASDKHGGIPRLINDLKKRQALWGRKGGTRFLKGGHKELSFFKDKARKSKVAFEVVLVQPGASLRTVSDDILRLLATTELFLKKTTQANFRVVINSAVPLART